MFRLLAIASFLSTIAVLSLPFLILQNERLVPQGEARVFDDVDLAKSVLKRLNPRNMDPTQETDVRVSDDELSRTARAALAGTVPSASVVVQAKDDGVWLSGSVEARGFARMFGRFLNAQVVVRSSQSGLEFSQVHVGSLSIPPWLVRPSVVFLVDAIVGEGKGGAAYDSIRRVQVKGTQIVVTVKPPAGLYDDFKSSMRQIVHRDNVPVIRIYYNAIVAGSMEWKGQKQISFSKYLSRVVDLARTRSADHDAIEENRAFILALALYFGDSRFQMLLGEVTSGADEDQGFNRDVVKLSGRHDWVQHFVTTAAIQVAAGSDISNFIGEAKEIVDADGPSGFSFTDIAADRAGVRFASFATRSTADARKLQDKFSDGASESDFFPRVTDLREGLSAAQFKAAYTDVGSTAYDRELSKIDDRIHHLPIWSD